MLLMYKLALTLVCIIICFQCIFCSGVNLSLSSGLYPVLEEDGFVEVCVLLEGETDIPVSADLFITGGTANGM